MDKKIIIGIGVLIVVGGGVLWWRGSKYGENSEPPAPVQNDATIPRNPSLVGTEQSIAVRHRYFSGMHTYSGTLTTPTPCHQVSVDARVMESAPEQIVLSFTVQDPEPGTLCAQVIAEQPFSVTARASEQAAVTGGELNGAPVRLIVEEGGVEFNAPPLGVELVP
jgi:hypothetical protein